MTDTLFNAKIITTSNSDLPSTYKCHITFKNNILDIRLISTSNIFTFHICTISIGDFSITKREQGIKVDFNQFIKTTINYFHNLNNTMTAFLEKINENIKFSFVENNAFRNITRLELMFYKPDENEFRRYLSESIARYEYDNVRVIKENNVLRESMKSKEEGYIIRISGLESEYNELKNEYDSLYNKLCTAENRNGELIGTNNKLESKILGMEKRIGELEIDNEKLKLEYMKKEKNDEMIENMKDKIDSLQDTVRSLERQNKKLKDENKDINSKHKDIIDLENDYKEEIKRLKKEKDERGKKVKGLERMIDEQKYRLNEQIELCKRMENERNEMKNKLENAQSVYNHFYRKNTDKDMSEDSTFEMSIKPESPPR